MKVFNSKFNLTLIGNIVLSLLLMVSLAACTKDKGEENPKQGDLQFDTEEYSAPTADALAVVSDLPAYIFPYEYQNFGAALLNLYAGG